MDKFRQISTELWPLFQNDFLCIEDIPWRGMLHACSAFMLLLKTFITICWVFKRLSLHTLNLMYKWGKILMFCF